MIEIKGQSCIAGNWITPPGKTFSSFNPYKKESMYGFASCGTDEIEQAADAAENAFQAYRQLDGNTIGAFLNTVADEIEALGDQLLDVCDSETGLGLARLTGERGRTCGQLRAFAELTTKGEWVQASIDTALPDRAPVPKPDLRRMMRANRAGSGVWRIQLPFCV